MQVVSHDPVVEAVDLQALQPVTDGAAADTVADAVPAFGARWDAARRTVLPAELLLLHPAAVDVTEMKR